MEVSLNTSGFKDSKRKGKASKVCDSSSSKKVEKNMRKSLEKPKKNQNKCSDSDFESPKRKLSKDPNKNSSKTSEKRKKKDIEKHSGSSVKVKKYQNRVSLPTNSSEKGDIVYNKCETNVEEIGNEENALENVDSGNSVVERDNKISDKKDAFQFMMESRLKSIGQNSPGKELDEEQEQRDFLKRDKQKLSARKILLENWAATKGLKKRKAEQEEERKEYIEHVLENRKKRMKKLLSPSNIKIAQDSDEEVQVAKKRIKKVPVIQTDSETSNESEKCSGKICGDFSGVLEKNVENNAKEKVIKNSESKGENLKDKKFTKNRKATKSKLTNITTNIEQNELQSALNIDLTTLDDSTNDTSIPNPKKLQTMQSTDPSNMISRKHRNSSKKVTNRTPVHQNGLLSFLGLLKSPDSEITAGSSDTETVLKDHKCKVRKQLVQEHDVDSIIKIKMFTPKIDEVHKRRKQGSLKCSETSTNVYSENDDIISDVECVDVTMEPEEHLREIKHRKCKDVTGSAGKDWRMKLRLNIEDTNDKHLHQSNGNFPKRSSRTDLTEVHEGDSESQGTESITLSSGSEWEDEDSMKSLSKKKDDQQRIKTIKLAPLFLRASVKPKVDPEVLEARKRFLNSGLPETLMKVIEKQKSLTEELECEKFPSISHVKTKPTEDDLKKHTVDFWNLPRVNLKLKEDTFEIPRICNNANSLLLSKFKLIPYPSKFTNISNHRTKVSKKLIKQIKTENSNYPVYRAFRILEQKYKDALKIFAKEKVELVSRKCTPKKGKKKGKLKQKALEEPLENMRNSLMWTEKYKPSSSGEIFGNLSGVSELKRWLESWLEFRKEINTKRMYRGRSESTSSSEFEMTDSNSSSLPGNTLILVGPHGCGKTTAVYAVCNELDINVLEFNASSKRTGKRLLQELQEATQSHQVRKGQSNSSINTFVRHDRPSSSSQSSEESVISKSKMCLLLIEDVDLVFEQDEGFLNALSQILLTSKRPVILTSADPNCLHLQKFVNQYPIVTFASLSSKTLGIWLQMVCLVEGLMVNRESLCELLECSRGDARATLMQLQFWAQSGGNVMRRQEYKDKNCGNEENDDVPVDDENSNDLCLKDDTNEVVEVEVHGSCVNSWTQFEHRTTDLLWWNIFDIFRMKADRHASLEVKNVPIKKDEDLKKYITPKEIGSFADVFDSLSLVNVLEKCSNIRSNVELTPPFWKRGLKDSLHLGDCSDCYEEHKYFSEDFSYTVLENCVERLSKNDFDSRSLCLTVPTLENIRWRIKRHSSEEALLQAVPLSIISDRRATSTDYAPYLRDIARTEAVRCNSNVKRGNRFYHYLRGLGLDTTDDCFKIACETLNSTIR